MKKFFFIAITVCFTYTALCQNVDLNNLTPSQYALYQKYIRMQNLPSVSDAGNNSNIIRDEVKQRVLQGDTVLTKPKLKANGIFGSELFTGYELNYEPNFNIPTPVDYELGAYDELLIDVAGNYDISYKLNVTPEGTVKIPYVGMVRVGGLTVDKATALIVEKMSKVYSGIGSGETLINVSLGKIRSIRVTVVGEARLPGTYTLPSLATAYNALYACGGPSDMGSMRDIKVIRNGDIIARIDVYKFLLDGYLDNNVQLKDEDVINIGPFIQRVTINGAVKRPEKFETVEGETIADVIRYAGGYTDMANKNIVTVTRIDGVTKKVIDVSGDLIASTESCGGDVYNITAVYDKYKSSVAIMGEVYRPGHYALTNGTTLNDLIDKASGITDHAFLDMAYIKRQRSNNIPEIIGFNLGDVMNANVPDIMLANNDTVVIMDLYSFKKGETVSIYGEVKAPGTYDLTEELTIRDLIMLAHGFTDIANRDSVILVRPVKNKETLLQTRQTSISATFSFADNMNLKNSDQDSCLKNGDRVIVRKIPGYEDVGIITVSGEVLSPGQYNITNKYETISDVIGRAGGLNRYAYAKGAYLIRKDIDSEVERKHKRILVENSRKRMDIQQNMDAGLLEHFDISNAKDLDSIRKQLPGKDMNTLLGQDEGIVAIDLEKILGSPKGKYDLYLEDGDIIHIPREYQTVQVLGEVLFPAYVRYDNTRSFRQYISKAGGFSKSAMKRHSFVIYPNGEAKSTKNFIGIKNYPSVEPGSRIIVPQKPVTVKTRISAGESAALATSIATVASIIISIITK